MTTNLFACALSASLFGLALTSAAQAEIKPGLVVRVALDREKSTLDDASRVWMPGAGRLASPRSTINADASGKSGSRSASALNSMKS